MVDRWRWHLCNVEGRDGLLDRLLDDLWIARGPAMCNQRFVSERFAVNTPLHAALAWYAAFTPDLGGVAGIARLAPSLAGCPRAFVPTQMPL
jgi:hypothetical protein